MLTLGKSRAGKGACDLDWQDVAEGSEGLLAILVPDRPDETCAARLRRLKDVFGDRAYFALSLRRRPGDQRRFHELSNLAATARVKTVTTNDVLYHQPDRRILQDVVTCIREGCTIDEAGFRPRGLRAARSSTCVRKEGISSQRCLIPATAFFEYTGTKYPKTRHCFTLKAAPFMAIAAIWRPAENGQPECFSMLTTEPGPDVAPIHNRQLVVLNPADWPAWIYLIKSEQELMWPLPPGSLQWETV